MNIRNPLDPDIEEILKKDIFKIVVRPNANETQIKTWNAEKQALLVDIAAPADEGKANKEVMRYFSKLLKTKVRIKSGMRSKEKLIEKVR